MCLNKNCDVRLCLLCFGNCTYIIKEPISVKISASFWPHIFANVSASIEGMMRKSHVAPLGFGEGWQLSAKALFRQSDLAQTKNCERKIDRDNYVKKYFFEKQPIKSLLKPPSVTDFFPSEISAVVRNSRRCDPHRARSLAWRRRVVSSSPNRTSPSLQRSGWPSMLSKVVPQKYELLPQVAK